MNSTPEEFSIVPKHVSELASTAWPSANDFRDLVRVALEAARLDPPLYLRSIFGPPSSWVPPHRWFSEYNIIDPWRLLTTTRFLLDITVPASSKTSPDWARTFLPPVINRLFWRPTRFFRHPDEYGGVSTFPREHWFFINGVATNHDVARLNASYLAHLFHRPVSVIQNGTASVLFDLFECAIGKGLNDNPNSADRKTMTEPAWRATAGILEALNSDDIERVVVIAHSQGTIIMANVLRAIAKILHADEAELESPSWHAFTNELIDGVDTSTRKSLRDDLAHAFSEFTKGGADETAARLAKLEIYTFANCADKMRYVYPELRVPYMEHFANGLDLVARLGVLSPLRDDAEKRLIEIDGPVFLQKEGWGHLLNVHYLMAINNYLYPGTSTQRREEDPYAAPKEGPAKPRLYEYFHGVQPKLRAQTLFPDA